MQHGGYVRVTDAQKPLPGDYLRYMDDWDKPKGGGILVKTIVDPNKPLTGSYYVLLNKERQLRWKVPCHRYTFYLMRHRTKDAALGDYVRSLVVEKIDS